MNLSKYRKIAEATVREKEAKEALQSASERRYKEKKELARKEKCVILAQKLFNDIPRKCKVAAKNGNFSFVIFRGCNNKGKQGHPDDCDTCTTEDYLTYMLIQESVKFELDFKHHHEDADPDGYNPPSDDYWTELTIKF